MSMIRDAAVIARRDFVSIVATPTFLVFLLAPLLMLVLGVVSGSGAAAMADSATEHVRIVAILDEHDAATVRDADTRMRTLYRPESMPPALTILPPAGSRKAQMDGVFADKSGESRAVMAGPLSTPDIQYAPNGDRFARYLAALAEQALQGDMRSHATMTPVAAPPESRTARQASGFGAVFGIFFLTLLLASQSVGMLAEEKSNKVIEILAAAVRLEAVFLGKLSGMFGVALVFVGFWASLLGGAVLLLPGSAALGTFQPAVGLPAFAALCALYFTMAYMLLGAVFLGVGAQAGTMREIQMLSLPITIFQVAMFGLSSAAAGSPGSAIARFAEWFPFSSPFAMAARASTDGALWPHLVALAWQGLWVGLTIFVAARLFRFGVLKSGGGWRALLGRPSRDVRA